MGVVQTPHRFRTSSCRQHPPSIDIVFQSPGNSCLPLIKGLRTRVDIVNRDLFLYDWRVEATQRPSAEQVLIRLEQLPAQERLIGST